MNLKLLTPKQSLNKAYLKEKISRTAIEHFKAEFTALVDKINDKGDEEHLKSLITQFLTHTYYDQSQHQVNPIGKNDLVIHTGKSPADPYGVILEVKSPTNKAEMINADKPNVKAFHELVLYYLDERIGRNRNELKQLVITNIYDWYIIDANEFDKKIYRNPAVKKLYDLKKSDGKDNPWFYEELKKLLATSTDLHIDATCFDLRDYRKIIANTNRQDDKGLIALYKILSPVHLLKLPFANDSNTLQPKFYSELLHLIGLYEYKEGSKKLISRKKEGERNPGSLLENAIVQLDSHDKVSRLDKPSQYGDNNDERIYNVALELVITWINRILFLKLLEAQLINYHKGNRGYKFLDKEKITDFDELDKLFFRVLAKKASDRTADVQKLFGKVPYLNSSLFEPTELEQQTFFINSLENNISLPVIASTVLKDAQGKIIKGSLETLDYLFAFLNAYDFSSEGAEEIQEDNKQLINASVLGLIFEKINGYKDGSFFTPGFITMYMCRETIRRAVVQKFNEAKGWDFKEYAELYDKISDKREANTIINSLKICDPAVGSGHFLVSALNEIIAIKSDLRVLTDREGRSMHHYGVEVVNDELIITDEDGDIFEYSPASKESQRVQETLFHEKQTIIENCLFGVDINPNSVKICRLRLWIELLKNAYYKTDTTELETLPNIDINIKIGNSLISRNALDADLKPALRGSKWNINDYRIAVSAYKNATDKNAKHELVSLIDTMKSNFKASILNNGKEYKDLSKLRGQLDKLIGSNEDLFGVKKNKKDLELEQRRLELSIEKQEAKIEDIKSNKIYQNAFEWRFEFPEVLNDDGDFVGFDLIIGNPPYGVNFNRKSGTMYEDTFSTFNWRGESYILFVERALTILRRQGVFGFIIPDTLLNLGFTQKLRSFILKNAILNEIDLLPANVFADATVDTLLLFFSKCMAMSDYNNNDCLVRVFNKKDKIDGLQHPLRQFKIPAKIWHEQKSFNIQSNDIESSLVRQLDERFELISNFADMFSGIKTYEVNKGNPPQSQQVRDLKPFTSTCKEDINWLPFFDGKDIGYYQLCWKENNWIKYGKWLAAPRLPENFEGEKILIRKITAQTLIAHYIDYTSYCNTLLFVLKLKPDKAQISYRALLGVINSKFIGWYFRKKFQISNEDTFPQIMIRDILQFSIPNVKNSITQKIENSVDDIILSKQKWPNNPTNSMEAEIDQLVYQLYGLTNDEIKIVEAN